MPTYKIIRLFRDSDLRMPIKEGLTLEEAQAHCQHPETSSKTAKSDDTRSLTKTHGPWFDAYYPED